MNASPWPKTIKTPFKAPKPETMILIEAPFTLRGQVMPEPKAPPAPRYDSRQMQLFG